MNKSHEEILSLSRSDNNDAKLKLIKSNSEDNLCNRSLRNNKNTLFKNKLNSQEIIKRADNDFPEKDFKGKEKDVDNADQVKILKTVTISQSK